MKVRIITRSEVEELISVKETIEAVEEAFKAKGNGRAQMPLKSYVFFEKYDGDFRVMPAYLEELGAAGVKIVNTHPQNPERHDMPSVMATILLLDPKTGTPLAIMDGTRVTDLRTGASGAVAVKYLARSDSQTVGMIGTGAQARTQLSALNEVFEIEEVRAYSPTRSERKIFAKEMSDELELEVNPVDSIEKAVKKLDIIVTTTPVRSPIILDKWVSGGMHINAIGADAPGKQELESKILERAKIIVDDWEQASHGGEINVPLSEGELTKEDVYADIGEVVVGEKEGRSSDEEITIFDSTGLAIQDIATA